MPTQANTSARRTLTAARVLAEVIMQGGASRSRLAGWLGVSKASISRAVEELIGNGWVEEGARFRVAQRGRSATSIIARAGLGYIIGADLEGSAARACIFDCQRNVIGSRRRAIDPSWAPQRIGAQIRALVYEVIADADVPSEKLIALGLALPGVATLDGREVRTTFAQGKLTRVGIHEMIGDFELPIVAADNTFCVSDYERRFGVAADVQSFASVLVRYGIGAAICSNGRFLSGEAVLCSELGHVRMQLDGEECICGQRGCLDTLASGRTWPSAEERHGERWEADLANRAHHLGVGIANILKIVPLPVVVLNGIYNAYPDIVRPAVNSALNAALEPIGLQVPSLRFGDDLESKASISAGLRALDQCLGEYLERSSLARRSA